MNTPHPARHLLPGLLAVSCSLPALAADGGFMEDAKATLNLRNFYINRNFVDPGNRQSKAEEWTQSFILDARSGFNPRHGRLRGRCARPVLGQARRRSWHRRYAVAADP